MNSNTTLKDPEAALAGSHQRSRLAASVAWAIILIGPVPLVLAPILMALSRIESWPVYLFALFAWSAVLSVFASMVRSRWNRIWPALCVLVPLPDSVAKQFDQAYLQLLSRTVSFCWDALGIPFRDNHSHFEFARFAISVDECLTNSPFIVWMLFVSCIVFSWLRRPMVLLPAYLGTAIFWVFGMHLVQLCAIGFMRHKYEIDIGTGWLFVLLNATTVLGAIGLTFSTDRCLRILFMPVPLADVSIESINPMHRAWNRMLMPLATDHIGKS